MKIAFHDNSLCLRGTTVALYDYAYYAQKFLNIEPIIVYNNNHPANNLDAINKFQKKFTVYSYNNTSEIDTILSNEKCDAFFMIKAGRPDGVITSVAKNFVNAIGICDTSFKHGDIFAMGSEWLAKVSPGNFPFVPYMVNLPDVDGDLREELNIPKEAFVFGRNGGEDTFNIPWAHEAVIETLNKRSDAWFIFQLTNKFVDHERAIFLPGNSDLEYKVKFINTSDVMLHARDLGESFGCSCAEFSSKNKPVITFFDSPEKNHIETLKDKGIFYRDKNELLDILLNINKTLISSRESWNAYTDHTPDKIMQKFKQVYLNS